MINETTIEDEDLLLCTRDKDGTSDTVAPSSQGSKRTRRKGTRNWKPTFAEKNTPTTLASSKSPIKKHKKESTANNTEETKKKTNYFK